MDTEICLYLLSVLFPSYYKYQSINQTFLGYFGYELIHRYDSPVLQ